VGSGDPAAHGLSQHLRGDSKSVQEERQKRYDRWNSVTRNGERWRARKAALQSLATVASTNPAALAPPSF